ncbi:ferredoxin--NADP reductase [Methanolobus profundi]|uniref:Ferredoxin-NADP reductase n=1 Tax=Methanolobus profundi TaxID=487685 RepID=A0A1I4R1H2_9EURY|nr:FAD-binding oxidoreductase [Methanolobus profundi]SFM45826.1 Ferredoxin-NADP reductase [Methanolobus profundi]
MKFEEPVTEIIQRAYNVKSFRFNRPEAFDFKAGQYITVTLDNNGKKTGKPFTISSSPTEREHIEFTKKLTGHEYSNLLDAMGTGDTALISGPFGKMTFEGEYEKIALLSGGIGITPMISICKYATDMKLSTDIMLICSDKTEQDMVFTEELEDMKKENPRLSVFNTLTRASENWKGCRDRICSNMIEREIPDYAERIFYVCGPPPMVDSMMDMLHEMKIPDSMIYKESLTGY